MSRSVGLDPAYLGSYMKTPVTIQMEKYCADFRVYVRGISY